MERVPYEHHKLECAKCHRKILVEIVLFGISHNSNVVATCAECMGQVSESFRAVNPVIAEDIQTWLDERKSTVCEKCGGTGILKPLTDTEEFYCYPCGCRFVCDGAVT